MVSFLGIALCSAFASDEPKWNEVHTAHFNVLTDAGEKRGREVALRMEQMRALFGQLLLRDKLKMSLPITVIALKSDKYFGFIAPTGRFRPLLNATNNIGSGYWGYLPSISSTIYLTKNKGTIPSVFSAYEFHGKKRYTNITPGQTYDLEWGLGQALPIKTHLLQFGVVGIRPVADLQEWWYPTGVASGYPLQSCRGWGRRHLLSFPNGMRISSSGTSRNSPPRPVWKGPR